MKVKPLGCSSAEIFDPGIEISNANTNTHSFTNKNTNTKGGDFL